MSTNKIDIPIMVNGCSGKMGKAVIKAADSAGLQILPVSFGSPDESGNIVQVCGNDIKIHGPPEREDVLASIYDEHPNLIVVDYTVPTAVNAMEIMAEQFPGAFSGYSLQVLESHQAGKLDTSGTAKAVISCFQKLGVSFDTDKIQMIRDPKQQIEVVCVPEEYLSGHAFHMYHLTSPDQTVSFEFQHNVCGRSIYAEGTVDAIIFLAKKIQSRADKRIYNMIDVLREGNMR
ncbi:hypothetical protein GH714_031564 [Hevea brasiliensis]|uniref:Dihydrodipicolinate reductase C-terminal domain-containing protein n=1 Tax=Hevea brasiliensis TaxID=3981 RepID=A0A6A6NK27_HEVBR|nr:hypothetical protein GH714_031564 [Hevea brasiliensis]